MIRIISLLIVTLVYALPYGTEQERGDTTACSDTVVSPAGCCRDKTEKTGAVDTTPPPRRKRDKLVLDKEGSMALHQAMLSAQTSHRHGFSHLKVHRGKGPLQPQTFCPVMGGPIDTAVYADYEGWRVFFCCAGCVYQFKLTPALYLQTLKRYGEEPGKSPVVEDE